MKSRPYIVSLRAPEALVTVLAALLEGWNLAVRWPDRAGAPVRLEVFCASRCEARECRDRLQSLLARAPAGRSATPAIRAAPLADWAHSWKRHFRARWVSRRIVVRPPWEKWPARPGERVVVIEPGQSFGTGSHATTRACLRWLDRLLARWPDSAVLDIGCGSGILAVAAARLGAGQVDALDNDPGAVRAALANARRNRVAGRLRVFRAAIETWRPRRAYGVVVANLLAGLLADSAGRVAAAVAAGPESRLVLSGILTAQYPVVRRAYLRLGFREEGRLTAGGWTTGCFRRRAPRLASRR